MNLRVPYNAVNLLTSRGTVSFSKWTLLHGVSWLVTRISIGVTWLIFIGYPLSFRGGGGGWVGGWNLLSALQFVSLPEMDLFKNQVVFFWSSVSNNSHVGHHCYDTVVSDHFAVSPLPTQKSLQFIRPALQAPKCEYNRYTIFCLFRHFLSAAIRASLYHLKLCPSTVPHALKKCRNV